MDSRRHIEYLARIIQVNELHKKEPDLSTRQIAYRLEIPPGSVSRYLSGKKYYYYEKKT
jgi:hypothetical protein